MNKILIIEDERILLYCLEQRLKKENYKVDVACDGREAVRFLRLKEYSLILADLMLPFVSGFELIGKIRSDERNSQTPVLVISGLGSENTIAEALAIGANDFLTKPFSLNVLMDKVQHLVTPVEIREKMV